jgi:hypothetical protein
MNIDKFLKIMELLYYGFFINKTKYTVKYYANPITLDYAIRDFDEILEDDGVTYYVMNHTKEALFNSKVFGFWTDENVMCKILTNIADNLSKLSNEKYTYDDVLKHYESYLESLCEDDDFEHYN